MFKMTTGSAEPARKLSPERQSRILAAARALILRVGLRATTMEAIALEAGVAKPTLYGYFADKQAVYQALLDGLMGELRAAFDAGLASDDDPVARIAAAIAGKYKLLGRVLAGSPHAPELYDEHGRLGASHAAGEGTHAEREITSVLSGAGVARPRQLAQLILAAAYGVARKAGQPAEIGPAIRLLVERLVRPEL